MAFAQQLPDEVDLDITFSEVSLDSALLLLSTKSGVNITYDPQILPAQIRPSVSTTRMKLGLLLDNVLLNTGLVYRIVGNQLIIIRDPYLKSKNEITVNGYVQDAISGERLVFASVYTGNLSKGVISNEYGFYSITLPKGEQFLHFSYLGYSKEVLIFDLTKDTALTVELMPDNELNEVVIIEQVPQKYKQVQDTDELPVEMLLGMSSLMGEPDLFHMNLLRAGINAGADGLGGFSVRGGNPDQNLVLMDGVPVYNTGHALGLFSVFNGSVIKSANLIKGGFTSRYGGRLSSVMDVRIKEGNNRKMQGDFAISPLIARASLEGPIKKGRSSFLVSGRRTIVDPWLRPLSKYQFEVNDESGEINFLFYDVNTKLNFYIGTKDEIYVSGYTGKDTYDNEVLAVVQETDGLRVEDMDMTSWNWGNNIATVRWNHIYSRKVFSHLSLSYSNFTFENFDFNRSVLNPGEPASQLSYGAKVFDSDISNIIGSLDFDYFMSPSFFFKWGINMTSHKITPGISFSTTEDDLLNSNGMLSPNDLRIFSNRSVYDGREIRGFIENEVTLGKILTANLGLHVSLITASGRTYRFFQPRLALQFNLTDRIRLYANYSEMDQYLHLLSTSGLGLPNDVWIPSTDEIAPQQSTQFSTSLSLRVGESSNISFSGYYKEMSSLRGFTEGNLFAINDEIEWEETIPEGNGTSRGLEVELEKRTGRFKGWMNYTYSRATRTFDQINNGVTFFSRYDRRHSVKMSTIFQFNENLEMSVSWMYATGNPFTVPSEVGPVPVDNGFDVVAYYNSINNIRLPDFHRLDFAVNLYTAYSWGKQKVSFGAYNTYNRNNPFFLDLVSEPAAQSFGVESVSILPIVPFVSIGLAF
jgi:hypothetical protein